SGAVMPCAIRRAEISSRLPEADEMKVMGLLGKVWAHATPAHITVVVSSTGVRRLVCMKGSRGQVSVQSPTNVTFEDTSFRRQMIGRWARHEPISRMTDRDSPEWGM